MLPDHLLKEKQFQIAQSKSKKLMDAFNPKSKSIHELTTNYEIYGQFHKPHYIALIPPPPDEWKRVTEMRKTKNKLIFGRKQS